MHTIPKSPLEKTCGMTYFARMLDKIRLQAAGALGPEYQENFGKGMDGWCSDFLRVDHAVLVAKVAGGGADEEIFEWCQSQGRALNRTDLFVWNQFVAKLGWNDIASRLIKKLKHEGGLGDRDDLVTMVDYMDVDEGRKP